MEANANSYITVAGGGSADGPGQLALLILDAHAMNADPDQFRRDEPRGEAAGHRADVRSRRRALRDRDPAERLPRRRLRPRSRLHRPQGSRTDRQCGGGQLADGTAMPERWLGPAESGQLPGGCTEDPSNGTGPDTNSTSLALQGLAAQGALTPSIETSALSFLTGGQDADGGWSYYPNSAAQPQQTDPQSTGSGDPGPAGHGPVTDERPPSPVRDTRLSAHSSHS